MSGMEEDAIISSNSSHTYMKMSCAETPASVVDHRKSCSGNKFGMHKNSRILSKNQPPKIRIIHVTPPQIIKTEAADFRNLVQRLTGKVSDTSNEKFRMPQAAHKDYQTTKSCLMTFSSFRNVQYYPERTLLLGNHQYNQPISSNISFNRNVSFGYCENGDGNHGQVMSKMVKPEEEEIVNEAATAATQKWAVEQRIGSGFCSDGYTEEYEFPVITSIGSHWETDLFENF